MFGSVGSGRSARPRRWSGLDEALAGRTRHHVMARRGPAGPDRRRELPGDELVPGPATVVTRGVEIAAPAEAAWAWLVSSGRSSRADCLIASGTDVRGGWREVVRGLALTTVRSEPHRHLVLYAPSWRAVLSVHLEARGPDACRLVARSRSPRGGPADRLPAGQLDPVTLLTARPVLTEIKREAEAAHLANA
jgi:hypothetical protein